MNFLQLLRSLDELLYELMSWLVFYPVTLWRTITRPLAMMDYADAELDDPLEDRYTDTLSPPLFLLLSLLLSHGLEIALLGDTNPLLSDRHGLAALIKDHSSLITFRLLIYSIFPMVAAAHLVRVRRAGLTRQSLQEPFYSQCYPTAALALLLGLGTIATQMAPPPMRAGGAILIVLALVAYWTVEARWFARRLGSGIGRGVLHAALSFLQAILLFGCLLPFLM